MSGDTMQEIEHTEGEVTDVQVVEESRSLALFGDDPNAALLAMESFIQAINARCTGEKFIANIEGRPYAKVDWWSAVGGSLSIFPKTEAMEVLDSDGVVKRRAWVSLWKGGQPIGPRASGLCSSEEVLRKTGGVIKSRWLDPNGNPLEYAIESMAITRATGKAFRQSMSILPVLAGLEPTPAEEMTRDMVKGDLPEGTDTRAPQPFNRDSLIGFGKHSDVKWRDVEGGYLRWVINNLDGDSKAFAEQELAARENVPPTVKDELIELLKCPGLDQEIVDEMEAMIKEKQNATWYKKQIEIVKGFIADAEKA